MNSKDFTFKLTFYYFSFVLILILFKPLAEQFFLGILKYTVFSVGISYPRERVLFLFIVVIHIFYLWYLFCKKEQISPLHIFGISTFFLVSLYYRFSGDPLHVDWPFECWIAVVVDLLFCLILIICSNKAKKSEETEENTQGFEQDIPINPESEGYKHSSLPYLAGKIVSRINHTAIKSKSFAISINGEWGLGKTSLLNGIKQELKGLNSKKEDENKHLVTEYFLVDFNPWKANSPDKIVALFFELLTAELSKVAGNIGQDIDKYLRRLLRGAGEVEPRFKFFNEIIGDKNQNIESLYNKVETDIERLGKKIVVFVDDVDRLDAKEILEVLRLIRNTASFRNVIFIAAFDREYVINTLNSSNFCNASAYLEKIFQFEFQLPPMPEKYMLNVFSEKMKKNIVCNYGENSIVNTEFELMLEEGDGFLIRQFMPLLRTYRDVRRFINQFNVSYSFVQEEVFFPDFVLLIFIKSKYPILVNKLYYKKNELFSGRESSAVFTHSAIDVNVLRLMVESYSNKEQLLSMLQFLFSDTHYLKIENISNGNFRICNKKSFDRYFDPTLRNKISIFELQSELSKGAFDLVRKFENLVDNPEIKEDVEYFLSNCDCKSTNDYKNLIETFFILSTKKYRSKFLGKSINFEYDRVNKLLGLEGENNKSNMISKNFDGNPNNQLEYVQTLLKRYANTSLASQMLNNLVPWMDEPNTILNHVGDYVLSAFNCELDEFSGYDDFFNVADSYRRSRYISIANVKHLPGFEEMRNGFKAILESNIDGFVEFIVKYVNNEGYKIADEIFWIFEKPEDLIPYLEKNNSSYVKEFVDFIDKLNESKLKDGSLRIPYVFKVIKVETPNFPQSVFSN